MISIVNYGLGNLGSLTNMFKFLGIPARVLDSPDELYGSEKILLPGVGAFDAGMKRLIDLGWKEALNEVVINNKVPALGICLGMQLMTERSEEGQLTGLGWIKGYTKKFGFPEDSKLKVPHMGWSTVHVAKESQLIAFQDEVNRFYFVHSYHVVLNNQLDTLITADYGGNFVAGFEHENIFGVQFHPEKSHRYGMNLFLKFAKI